jgi:hypothetical protein
METEKLKKAVDSLVYYLKYYDYLEHKDLLDYIKQIKTKVLTSSNLKDRSVIDLFNKYTEEQITKSLEESVESDRYYRYKIITNLLTIKTETI